MPDDRIGPRFTRMIVEITWNDYDEDDREGRRYYHDDDQLFDVAGDWIAGAFEDRDDSPGIKIIDITRKDGNRAH